MASPEEVRIGLVGLGPRGIGAWLSNCQRVRGGRLTAICDQNEAFLKQAYEGAGDPDIACYS